MKRLTAPSNEVGNLQKNISAPSTPSSGYTAVYAKTDKRLYIKDDAGNEYVLLPASGTSKLSVSGTAPSSPTTNDVWVDVS